MTIEQTNPATIDAYIATYPPEVQDRLQAIRAAIHEAAPEATEAISYGVPTFVYMHRNLISFGAAKHHIGIYPTPSAIAAFQGEIAGYKSAKGSFQLPEDQPIPADLIRAMTGYRVNEVATKAATKKSPKKKA